MKRDGRGRRGLLWIPSSAMVLAACSHPLPVERATLSVTIEEASRFYEAGEPIPLRIDLFNPGEQAVRAGAEIVEGSVLELLAESGERLAAEGHKTSSEASSSGLEAEIVPPQGRRVLRLDAAALFPGLGRPGRYLLTAVYPHFRSNTVRLHILPRFRVGGEYRATVETDHGSFSIRLLTDAAPRHVRNFVALSRCGFYDNTYFHRIVPRHLVQAGDPTGTGTGGPGYRLSAEPSDLPHERGTMSMVREQGRRDSSGSQWFICLTRMPELDGTYTVFGRVEEGMDTLDRIGSTPVQDEIPQEPVRIVRISVREAGD